MAEPIRLLHVDDEPDFADLAATYLEREDGRITVETATSASDGLDLLADHEIDCIVSDYDMPGTDGIEFLETVREQYPDLPFILFTGKGSEEVASDAITAGATDYLQKGRGTDQYELLANRVRNGIKQYRATRRAAELDRVRTLASDVNQALVRATSREEAEASVCEIISESDPYLFAWIGEVDPETERVEPRTSAGIDADYLGEITITADENPTGRGPGGTAIRERRVAISQDIQDDPEFEPWREEALECGFRAVAAVPLEYDDSLYGELVVYAERPNAFDEDEQDLIAELGDDIAHALHSFDIRDRLRTERDRRRALFENTPSPVIAGDVYEEGTEHRIADVNDAFEDVFGYERTEVVDEDVAEIIVPEGGEERHEEIRERATAGEATIAEVERITADGPREFLLTNIPYGVDDELADGWYSWFIDISERSERERAIEDLHRTTTALMEAQTDEEIAEITVDAVRDILELPANGVYLYDESDGGLVPVSWTTETETIVGKPPIFPPGEGIAGTAFETGEPQIYDDISTVPDRFNPDTDIRSQIVLPLGDHGVLVIGSPEPDAFDDIEVSLAETLATHATTALERVEHEAELVRRQELFEAVLETSLDGVLVIDENREYVTWNQQFIDMWDIPEDLIGDESEEVGLEYALDRIEDPAEFIDKVEYLYEHPHEESRDEIRLTDGRVFDRYSAPVETDDGTYFGRVWFFRDITEQKQYEQELTRQNERLEAFAAVVSHDLRNPLNVADGRLELAREQYDSAHLDAVARAHDRIAVLVDDLLSLAQQGEAVADLESVDLSDLVENCWRNVETGDARVVAETDRTIRADRSRLAQLLENLIRNSVEHGSKSSAGPDDAVEHGGTDVTVTVGEVADGFYIADDGPGIPEDEREAVFEEGYSNSDGGTGFGLAIVAEIADAHGWDIRVTDSEAGGARFEITGVEIDRR